MKSLVLAGGVDYSAHAQGFRGRLGSVVVAALLAAAPLACGGSGGGAGTGGAGGGNAGAPGSGGAMGLGGSSGKGGATGTGGAAGATGTGGTGGGSGATGAGGGAGAPGTGGAAGAAGNPGTGGGAGTAGGPGTGGFAGAGGIKGTGGSGGTPGTGGAAGAAGTPGTGGAAGAAGTPGTGGAAGATGTGGAAGAAGATGTGGAAGAAGTTGSGGTAGAGGATVTPGVWSAPVTLAKGANWEKVILDGNGNAMLLYAIHPGTDSSGGIFSRALSPSTGWQPPQSIVVCGGCGFLSGASGTNIDADMNAAGLATLSWIDGAIGANVAARARRYDGHTWDTANETVPATATNLHVYVSPDGTSHVVAGQTDYFKPSSAAATDAWTTSATNLLSNANTLWSSFDAQGNGFLAGGSNTNANVTRFVAAAPAGWLGLQTAGTASAAMIPHVAAFPGQKGLIVWPDAGQVDYSTFTIAAGWTKQSTVGTLVSTSVTDLQMASNATSAVLTWLQTVGSVSNVYSSVYNGSAWATPALVSDGSHTAVDGAGHTPVGIDGQGNAFSLWYQGATTQPDIMFSRYASSSGTWSTPSKIATATGTVGYLQIAV